MTDFYIYAIVALLPLSACMLVVQSNPFHALIIRGILGAVAALVYALWGAPDVALTEALMGTLLAVILSAVAVRSSMVMRLGFIEGEYPEGDRPTGKPIEDLRAVFAKRYMRLELVPYPDESALDQAFKDKEIHAIYVKPKPVAHGDRTFTTTLEKVTVYQTATRLKHLYEIMKEELPSETQVTYFNPLMSPLSSSEQH
jgi:putative multicomponent Na+:H+ antiporter subunit B